MEEFFSGSAMQCKQYFDQLPPQGTLMMDAREVNRENSGQTMNSYNMREVNESLLDDQLIRLSKSGLGEVLGFSDSTHFAASLFVNKFRTICEVINRQDGKILLEASQIQAMKDGMTWYLCSITVPDWKDMIKKPAQFRCFLDRFGRGAELAADFLRLLLRMDCRKEYMLAFELVDPKTRFVEFAINFVMNPELTNPMYCPWKFEYSIMTIPDPLHVTTKWLCCGCYKMESKQKLKSCGKCRERRYCSEECQRKDWPLHKVACPLLVELRKPITQD